MLHEKEFFIRKAIGWILRDTSRKRPDMVYEWLAPRAHRASTLTVREATRHMAKERQERLVAAAKSGKAIT
jgi:3-methyladenine DNA glycosylase AlkD